MQREEPEYTISKNSHAFIVITNLKKLKRNINQLNLGAKDAQIIKKMKAPILLLGLVMATLMCSCGSERLVTYAVAYQSVRTEQFKEEVPNDANILVAYGISADGDLIVTIKNLSDEILIIDQTKTFFVNSDGASISYYDPTIRSTSQTSLASETGGASVNLGAVGGALGIGGNLGTLLSGINVGGSETTGSSTTVTTIIADQPRYSIAPKGMGKLSKNFNISGIGRTSLKNVRDANFSYTKNSSSCKFSVCISYSIDGGQTFDKIVTPFYLSSQIAKPVISNGKVNEVLRSVLEQKQDALYEPWWILYSVNNVDLENDYITRGALLDFK